MRGDALRAVAGPSRQVGTRQTQTVGKQLDGSPDSISGMR